MIPFTTFYGLHYNIVTWTPRSEDTPEGWEVWSTGKIELLVTYDSDHSSQESDNVTLALVL